MSNNFCIWAAFNTFQTSDPRFKPKQLNLGLSWFWMQHSTESLVTVPTTLSTGILKLPNLLVSLDTESVDTVKKFWTLHLTTRRSTCFSISLFILWDKTFGVMLTLMAFFFIVYSPHVAHELAFLNRVLGRLVDLLQVCAWKSVCDCVQASVILLSLVFQNVSGGKYSKTCT